MGAGIEGVASKKIGGAPVWVWGVVGAAAVIGFVWYRNRAASSAAAPAVVDPTTAGPTLDPGTGLPASPGSGDTTTPAPADWLSAALSAAATGGVTHIVALQALQRFLEGLPLSAAQVAIVDRAIAAVGLPPGFTPEVQTPAPAPAPKPATPVGPVATTLQLVPSQGSGIDSPTMYVYWLDNLHKGITGVVELQEQKSSTWYDVATIPVSQGSGHLKISVGKGKARTLRAQSLLTNPKYKQTTSGAVTVRG
jgi:hypothetical protein